MGIPREREKRGEGIGTENRERAEVMRVLEEEKLLPAFVNRFVGGIYRNEEELCGDT